MWLFRGPAFGAENCRVRGRRRRGCAGGLHLPSRWLALSAEEGSAAFWLELLRASENYQAF